MKKFLQDLQEDLEHLLPTLIGGALFISEIALFRIYWRITRKTYKPQKWVEISRQIEDKKNCEC